MTSAMFDWLLQFLMPACVLKLRKNFQRASFFYVIWLSWVFAVSSNSSNWRPATTSFVSLCYESTYTPSLTFRSAGIITQSVRKHKNLPDRVCAHELGLKRCKCGDRDFVVGVAGGFSGLTWACEPVKGHQSCEAHRHLHSMLHVFYRTAVWPIRSSHPGQDSPVAVVTSEVYLNGPFFCLCCANLSVVLELVAWMQKLIIFCHTYVVDLSAI